MPRLIDPSLIDALAAELTGRSDELQIASVSADLDPIDLVRAGSATSTWAGYFASPAGSRSAGWVWRGERQHRARIASSISIEPSAPGTPMFRSCSDSPSRPMAPSQAEWNGFAPASAVLPLVSVVRRDGEGRLTVAVPPGRAPRDILERLVGLVEPRPLRVFEAADHVVESRPAPAAWRDAVSEAVGAIRAGVVGEGGPGAVGERAHRRARSSL